MGAAGGFGAEPAGSKYTETIVANTGAKLTFEMARVPGGKFTMGSPEGETGREAHESPQRQVNVNPFYLCTTETTMEMFLVYYAETGTGKKDGEGAEGEMPAATPPPVPKGVDAVTGPTPVYGDMTMGFSKDYPAIGMTWHNAMTFCVWLSKKTGKKYRLPTEAEWECAARVGTTKAFGTCDGPEALAEFAWFEPNADRQPHPVGKKKPNAWGLHDMQGNVREWVHDFYSPTGYQEGAGEKALANPTGPKEGKLHVARGGCYDSPAAELRCAARGFEEDWWRMNDPQIPKSKWWLPQMDIIGFRVACDAE